MKKKAQLQMNETIFAVFIILIIVLLSFVAYSKFQEVNIKEQQRNYRNMQVIEMAHRLSFWPELECSEAGATEYMCLDLAKLMVLGDFINKSKQGNTYGFRYYYDLLKDSQITVKEVYPSDTGLLGRDYWILYNNPGNTPTTDTIRIPVSLYNPLTKTYAFGIMELRVYE